MFTVQVQSPVFNLSEPQEPIHWHWAVEVSSAAEALAIVERGPCKGMPAKIVPPLGLPCRVDLSWDPPYRLMEFGSTPLE